MRILQLIPTLTVGGAERMAANLARHLHRRGHRIEVVSMYDSLGTWIEAELRAEGVPIHFLGKRRGLDVRMFARVADVVRGFRPDVLHSHLNALKYTVPALALAPRCPIVHTIHTVADAGPTGLLRLATSLAFRLGVAPVAIGQVVADTIHEVYRVTPRRIIPNGIPVAEYAEPPGAREAVRAELGIPDGAPTFVSVGQFLPAKNHAGLIAAFASQPLNCAGAHLILAGDGPLRPSAESRVQELRVEDRVHFLGIRSDIPRILAAADVFVLASSREGNPLSVMEAMAAGKPVVATNVGCLTELVSETTGELVSAGDGDALAAAMWRSASDLHRAAAQGWRAAEVARERFDDAIMASAYEQLYREVA